MSRMNLRRRMLGGYFSDLEQRVVELENQRSQLIVERDRLVEEKSQLATARDALTDERNILWLEARKGIYNLAYPPDHLQTRVVGASTPHFLWSGEQVALDLEQIATKCGIDLAAKKSFLDFGCGVGRVTRVMAARHPHANHAGADIDAEAIEWDNVNLKSVAQFEAIPHRPPTVFTDNAFDFIYSISVFTHLPEDMQFEWLEELQRIVTPGGHLVLTYHGENHYEHIPADEREAFEENGFAYAALGNTAGLPDFYQVAFHTEEYIRNHWGRYFDIISIMPLAISGSQHVVICKN